MTPEAMAALHARVFPGRSGWAAKDFRDILGSPGAILCSGAHAFALGRIAADESELILIATDPDHQRRGLASGCLKDFERDAKVRGASAVFLEVARSNAKARAFYAAHSYAEIARRKDYYREDDGFRDTALILKRVLQSR